jgi:hypothetical protein
MAAAFLELRMAAPSRQQGDGTMDRFTLPSTATAVTIANPPAPGARTEALLRRSGYLALRDVTCVASDGVLYLSGRVPTYYLKQLAQEIAAGVDGVRLVINSIEVTAPAGQPNVGHDPTTNPAQPESGPNINSSGRRAPRLFEGSLQRC